MLLLFHIFTAVGSLAAAGASYVSPSLLKLRLTYILTASMFTSGTVLVIQNTSHLLKACVMGLALLGVISYATIIARNKLAAETSNSVK